MKISISENRLKVENSLCKFHLNSNLESLTREQTKEAINNLSDRLHLPLEMGKVSRVDVAANIGLKHCEALYIPYLGELKNHSRLMQDNGIYYRNGIRQIMFYGKITEMKKKREPIPESFRNSHLLRYELKIHQRLDKQFNRPEITAGLLYDRIFYDDLIQKWKHQYFKIQKLKNQKIDTMVLTGSKKQLLENLACLTVLELGQPLVLAKIKEAQEMGKITKKQAFDLRSTVREISKMKPGDNSNDLIMELDEKIKNYLQ